MPVDAVVAGVQLPADEPLPERRGRGVERGVPALIPGQQVRVLREAVRELVLSEPLEDRRVGAVGLGDEVWRRLVVVLLAPVNGDLGLGYLGYLGFWSFSHSLTSNWRCLRIGVGRSSSASRVTVELRLNRIAT